MSYLRAVLALGAIAVAFAGCGRSGASSLLSFHRVPLVGAGQVIAQARQCDRGAHAFCALELVLRDRRLASSGDLVTLEGRLLRHAGWTRVSGDSGNENGADSPGQNLHLSYGTALADLAGAGAGWFNRAPAIERALSREMLDRVPAIALSLSAGPA
jgi:hypothetical protein